MRNPPHIWKRFWSLKRGEHFFIGKKILKKHNAIVADCFGSIRSRYVAPWRRVRTTTPVKAQAFYDAKSETCPEPCWPRAKDCFTSDVQGAIAASGCVYIGDAKPWEHKERDPMVQDHTPEKPPENERTL